MEACDLSNTKFKIAPIASQQPKVFFMELLMLKIPVRLREIKIIRVKFHESEMRSIEFQKSKIISIEFHESKVISSEFHELGIISP